MFRNLFRLSFVLTVITALFAATVVQAAELKAKKVSAAGGTRSVTYAVTGEGATFAFTASVSGGEWLEIDQVVTPTSVPLVNGKGKVKVTYKVSAKTDAGVREGQVLIKAADALPETPATVIELVSQAGVPCKLRPAVNSTKFEFYGGEKSFAYTLPSGCDLELDADNWFTATDNGGSITVKAEELKANARTGKIRMTVKEGTKVSDKKMHTVTQSKRQGAGTAKVVAPFTNFSTAELTGKVAGSTLFAAKKIMEIGQGVGDFAAGALQPQCDEGTATKSGSNITFDKCRIGDQEFDGVMSVSYTGNPLELGANGTIKAGKTKQPLTITGYVDDTSNDKTDTMTMLLSLSFKDLKVDETGKPVSFTATVTGTIDNEYRNEDNKDVVAYLDVKALNVSLAHPEGATQVVASKGQLRSTVFADKALVAAADLAFQDFTVTLTKDELVGTTSYGATGAYAINTYPAPACVTGVFSVGTDPVIPFTYQEVSGVIAGELDINGAQTITIAVDGTASVSDYNGLWGPFPAGNINEMCAIN